MKNIFLLIIILIVIIVGLMYINNLFNVLNENIGDIRNIENFDTFSPYKGNEIYCSIDNTTCDQKRLKKTLKKWETPFNKNDEGYWNAEPSGIPPLVTIYAYDDRHKVRFKNNYFNEK